MTTPANTYLTQFDGRLRELLELIRRRAFNHLTPAAMEATERYWSSVARLAMQAPGQAEAALKLLKPHAQEIIARSLMADHAKVYASAIANSGVFFGALLAHQAEQQRAAHWSATSKATPTPDAVTQDGPCTVKRSMPREVEVKVDVDRTFAEFGRQAPQVAAERVARGVEQMLEMFQRPAPKLTFAGFDRGSELPPSALKHIEGLAQAAPQKPVTGKPPAVFATKVHDLHQRLARLMADVSRREQLGQLARVLVRVASRSFVLHGGKDRPYLAELVAAGSMLQHFVDATSTPTEAQG